MARMLRDDYLPALVRARTTGRVYRRSERAGPSQ
jgi:hypothetical protein